MERTNYEAPRSTVPPLSLNDLCYSLFRLTVMQPSPPADLSTSAQTETQNNLYSRSDLHTNLLDQVQSHFQITAHRHIT
jgi:hypothetical protein